MNGDKATIEEHKDAVGFVSQVRAILVLSSLFNLFTRSYVFLNNSIFSFVAQDDIVCAELTVRENFIYSGKF